MAEHAIVYAGGGRRQMPMVLNVVIAIHTINGDSCWLVNVKCG